jgi:HlyD family secretion protein
MMRKLVSGPRIVGVLILIALALAVWFLLRKPPLPVDQALVSRGPMMVTIDDLGETRVKDLYSVASPVTGELLRVPLKPGTSVTQGRTVLAEIQPMEPGPIDARSYAQTVAQISAQEAQLAAARARVQDARAAERLAASDHGRVAQLVERGFVSRSRYDQSVSDLARARAGVSEAVQAQDAALHSLQAAQASLSQGGRAAGRQRTIVTAPISGTVLRVLQESRRPVVSGTPLMELGNPDQLEIVADLLSADAVKVQPGASVEVDAWGGDTPIKGRVRLVEPSGFTKISALGVEEQRVNVVIDLAEPRLVWQRLGHGYRVTVRIALWSSANVLQVPIGALSRSTGGWTAFVVDSQNRARSVAVTIGHMNDETAQVLGGLSQGDRVIVHPGEKVSGGSKVKPQS